MFAFGALVLMQLDVARGEAPPPERRVIARQGQDLVVDLAGRDGAKAGDVVVLWRTIKLRHPITRQWLSDRFAIGRLELRQVRHDLSLARPVGKLDRAAEPGDVVALEAPPAADTAHSQPSPQPQSQSQSQSQSGVLAPDAVEVMQLFDALRNASPAERIRSYEGYAREKPYSPFARVLYEDAQMLRLLLQSRKPAPSASSGATLQGFEPPEQLFAGHDVDLGIELEAEATGAILQLRRRGELSYRSWPMQRAGAGFYTVRIPAAEVAAPRFDYFLEAVGRDGTAVPVAGTADQPRSTEVLERAGSEAPKRGEATLQILTDYADWNNLKHNDVVWQTEGLVGLRFADQGLRALRSGFGVYRGVGGSLEELDRQGLEPREVGLTYGYLEGEYGVSSFVGLIARGVVGLLDSGVSGGAQAFVRIGSDRKTNLLLGGEVLGGVGLRGITELSLATFERFPLLFRTEVTNQPAGAAARAGDEAENTSLAQGEVGARAIAQIGYRVTPTLVVALRGSYQGRTIRHAGPGVGGAVTFTW